MGIADLVKDTKKQMGVSNVQKELVTMNDRNSAIKNSLAESLELLADKLLVDVKEGKIDFNNPQDVKNLIMAVQTLNQDTISSDSTPQITGEVNNFYTAQFKLPDDTNVKSSDVTSSLEKMSSDDIKAMLEAREVAGNNENVAKM